MRLNHGFVKPVSDTESDKSYVSTQAMTYGHDCATIRPVMADDPAQRVRQRLIDWMEVTGLTQRDFAKELGRSQPWLDKILVAENSVRLKDLDEIADKLRTTASDLVRVPSERRTMELTPTEVRIVERLRRRPELTQACATLLDAYRPPTETQNPLRTAINAVNEAERIENEQRTRPHSDPKETRSPRRKRL